MCWHGTTNQQREIAVLFPVFARYQRRMEWTLVEVPEHSSQISLTTPIICRQIRSPVFAVTLKYQSSTGSTKVTTQYACTQSKRALGKTQRHLGLVAQLCGLARTKDDRFGLKAHASKLRSRSDWSTAGQRTLRQPDKQRSKRQHDT